MWQRGQLFTLVVLSVGSLRGAEGGKMGMVSVTLVTQQSARTLFFGNQFRDIIATRRRCHVWQHCQTDLNFINNALSIKLIIFINRAVLCRFTERV